MKKANGLPIYGLACPKQQITTTFLSPNEKKCGCKIKPMKQAPINYGNPVNTLPDVGSQIFDSVTNSPFEEQTVHILNMNNGEATVTQPNGFFLIKAQPSDDLKITHVGYGDIIIKASELTDKIVLDESSEFLDEIVLSPKTKKTGLVLLGLAAVFGIVYASSDDDKKTA